MVPIKYHRGIKKHGMTKSREYRSWHTMKSRCLNKQHPKYYMYGGRGITVCQEWVESFEQFYKDMGERPPNTSIDRVDTNRGYEPSNCKWSTPYEQQRNTRRNAYIEDNGERLTITDWSRKLGIPTGTLFKRKKMGWTPKEILHGK
jgi:hypothetical protein